jgi:hypothetical protein
LVVHSVNPAGRRDGGHDRGGLRRDPFDLWDVEDVRQHSELILQRLESGEMPCDDPWPAQNVALFRDWIAAGTPA